MIEQVNLSEFAGKTIKTICNGVYETSLIIVFTDGTFGYLIHETDYDGVCTITDDKLLLNECQGEVLVHLGIITAEELADERARRQKQHQKEVEKRERAAYEKLKAKFEGTRD